MRIFKKYGFTLINDACHSMGAEYYSSKKYAIKYADFVTHSYHPVKNITTGEGGAVLTNQKKFFDKINILRSHGIIKDTKLMHSNDGPWHYEMHELGFNYRITDIQSALGISQLKKINKFIRKRKEIAKIYDEEFSKSTIFTIPKVGKNYSHAYHLYPLLINFSLSEKVKLFNNFNRKKIKLQVHYVPIHLQPYYKKNYGFRKGDFPIAEDFYKKEVSLPIYYSLKKDKVFEIIKKIKFFCKKK